VDGAQVDRLRERLRETGWWSRALSVGQAVRRTRTPGGLLVVGTPLDEPWHLAAHLDDEARYSGLDQLRPTLLRWAPPAEAAAHLAVGLDRLESSGPGETVFVVAPDRAPEALLERIAAARRAGATLVSVDGGDPELEDLIHERFTVGGSLLGAPGGTSDGLDLAQHLVSAAAGRAGGPGAAAGRASKLGRLLRTR
jgi:hypothetical protein